jgi:type I restriction enzyme S subunit
MGDTENLPELPEGWVWTNIETLVEGGIQNGIYLPKSDYGSGTPILRIDDFQDGFSRPSSQLNLVRAKAEDIEKYGLGEGDLVINRVNSPSHLGKCLVVTSKNLPAIFESNMMRLRLSQFLNVSFIAFYLRSRDGKSRLISNAKWAVNQASINQTDVGNTPIPLPPFVEQYRVVAKIEELFTQLDAGVELLKKLKAKLKRYRQAVLKAAVEGKLTKDWREAHQGELESASVLLERILKERREKWEAEQLAQMKAKGKTPKDDSWKLKYKEPVAPDISDLPELPEGWVWAKLDQLLSFLRNGISKKPNAESGTPILRISAVRPMSVNTEDVRFLDSEPNEFADYVLSPGDLLFTRYNGNPKLAGVCGVVRSLPRKTVHPDKLIRAKIIPFSSLPTFLEIVLNVGYSRIFLASRVRTTAGQAGISGSDVRSIPLPLPPLVEQKHIVEEVERCLSVADELEKVVEQNLKRTEKLRQSILKKAFEGKLVPQDPTDEPADKLLERIKAEKAKREAETKAKKKQKQPGKSQQLELF